MLTTTPKRNPASKSKVREPRAKNLRHASRDLCVPGRIDPMIDKKIQMRIVGPSSGRVTLRNEFQRKHANRPDSHDVPMRRGDGEVRTNWQN